MHLTDALEKYTAVRNAGGSPDTHRLHRQAIRRFGETLGREPTLADLSDVNLGKHAQQRLAAGRARDTVAGEQAKLLALWRYCATVKLVDDWPLCKPISRVQRIPEAWSEAEFNRLYQAAHFATPVGNTPGHVWWQALFEVLLFTGERIGATLQLDWQGVDLEGGWLTMRGETRKGGVRDRRYKIPDSTVQLLSQVARDTAGPFAGVLKTETLYNRMDSLLRRAGLPHDSRSKFHRIRRTTASHYEAAGGNATELLGHSSRKVTRGYLDPRVTKPVQAVDLIFRPK